MDRRSILWICIFTLAFILVQMYFQTHNEEELQRWKAQKVAKLTVKKKQLQEDITSRTLKPEELPLVKLFSVDDKEQQNPLGWGIISGDGIVTLSINLPSDIQAVSNKSNEDLGTYQKQFFIDQPPQFTIFGKDKNKLLKVGQQSYFGAFDLQVINDKGIFLGEYVDGIFTLPAKELQKINEQLGEKQTALEIPRENSIVLMKGEEGFLPVGVYVSKSDDFLSFQTLEGLERFAILVPFKRSEKIESSEEKYYVLENNYQQLVFSTRGGALVEINLPLRDKTHPDSIVRPIELDQIMVDLHPKNARFPSHPYFKAGNDNQQHEGSLGGYYPLIRRDVYETNKKLSRNLPPQYYATNIVSDYPEVAELNYKVKEFSKDKIVFESKQTFRKITKTYTIKDSEAPYCFTLDVQIEGDNRSLWLTSGVPEVELISNSPAPALKYRFSRVGKSEVKQIDLPQEAVTFSQVQPDWICNSNGFFGIITDPLSPIEGGFRVQKVSGDMAVSRLIDLGHSPDTNPGYMMLMPLKIPGGKASFRFFAGPFATDLLKSIDQHYSDAATGYNPDYIASQSFHGWFGFISGPFANFLFVLMNFFHTLTGSWGFSIILLTVALRLMLYPLNAWSLRSSLQMQEVMPQIALIQEKYKKDPKRVQLEIMNIYRERRINPLSGCLPLLIQIPFLIGMFDLLKSAFELRGASFIPGWIDNLAAPDVLFTWNYSLPFIGNEFHLLPILTGIVMFFQQRWMSPAPKDPSMMSDKERQQKAMGSIFAVMFTFMFYNFPSGINIYWISTTFLGILQQWWSKRRLAQNAAKPIVIQTKK